MTTEFVSRRTQCVVSVAPEICVIQLLCTVVWGGGGGAKWSSLSSRFALPPSSFQYHNDNSSRMLRIFI